MADEKNRGQGASDEDFGALTGGNKGDEEGGLGNLPPLSDFESDAGMNKGLINDEPGRFDSGLPPLGEIQPEVPRPTGGNIRPAPPGFEERSAFDTPISDSGLDTPQPSRGGTSFQDLTTDSDFSPETPEIGPGPDSDLETPMFDSAFGPGSGFDRTPDTSAPTQAMETPIFGDRGGTGFDADAFGGRSAGTPIPDFSPDTGIPGRVPPAPPAMTPPMTRAESSGGGWGKAIAVGLLFLILGAAAGAWFADRVPFAPATSKIEELEGAKQAAEMRVQTLSADIARLQQNQTPGTGPGGEELPNPEEYVKQIDELQGKLATLQEDVLRAQNDRDLVAGDLERLNQEYAEAQSDFEDLKNQTDIERARSEGLAAEVARLQSQVGQLEEAANRAQSVKQGLLADINRLEIAIQESISLTPAKYSYDQRLEDVRALKNDVQSASVVTPEHLNRYAELNEREMNIARTREYFFAKIPVKDRYGVTRQKWAEALMNGNWSVYFRTLDGKEIGVYEQVQGSNPPQYAFRQFLPPATEKQIEQEIIAARTPGYEQKINALAQREITMQDKTGVQRVFDSL
jgi:peptidoglycan hydrolase CwlO-like protein